MKLFLASTFISFALVVNSQSGLAQSKDETAIRAVVSSYYEAFSKKDAQACANLFAENADFTNMSGGAIHGRKAIEEMESRLFKQPVTLKTDPSSVTIHFLKPDLAIVDSFWELSGMTTPEGKAIPDRKGMVSSILLKEGTQWVIQNAHNISLIPPASTAVPSSKN